MHGSNALFEPMVHGSGSRVAAVLTPLVHGPGSRVAAVLTPHGSTVAWDGTLVLVLDGRVATVPSVDQSNVGHRWAPITDLTDGDRAAASEEIPVLVRIWDEIRQQLGPAQVNRFNERVKREWAIETGIIEGLYTLDQGTTRLLVERGIDASLIAGHASGQSPEFVAGIISDQVEAVDWLFDAVTNKRPLSTSFVKELHSLMTRKQLHASGIDALGRRREVELLHGRFKQWPNDPVRPDGKVHEYCPPMLVDAEMDRLIELHSTHIKQDVAPDVSAAWLHHRFTQIHPFQDGNGRIAKAIASLVLIDAGWFPLVVDRNDRDRYIKALVSADEGNLAPLTKLVAEIERKWFLRALSIVEDLKSESRQVERVLDVISDQYSADTQSTDLQLGRARDIAEHLCGICRSYFEDVKMSLESSFGDVDTKEVWFDSCENYDTSRRHWHRYPIIQVAQELGYFANLPSFHEWVRLGIDTENGRAEILTSFHAIGKQYRGLVGVSMCLYRRQHDEDATNKIIKLIALSDDVFQVNYAEDTDSVERRFNSWLEESLALGLDEWRRGE